MLQARTEDFDQRVFFNFSWDEFERFLALRGDAAGTRVTYLDGTLEIMSPSHFHEGIKSQIGRLLELWAAHEGVDLVAWGSTTLKKKSKKASAEPDECYVVGRSSWPGKPDLAIEVTWTAGGLEKLEVYRRLGVREVWFWEDDRLLIFVLKGQRYVRRSRSAVLPTLDPAFLSSFVVDRDQARAVRGFMAALRRN